MEMHEVFLTRGDVQGSGPTVQEAIQCFYNCVLVHPECHSTATTEFGNAACVRHLILFEGYCSIRDWLMGMVELMKGGQAGQEVRYLRSIAGQMEASLHWIA
jgi:hypothetical protein